MQAPKIGLFPFVQLAPGVQVGVSCLSEHALAALLVPPHSSGWRVLARMSALFFHR